MDDKLIRTGLRVATRRGKVTGRVHSVTRHPITRKITAVILDTDGNEDNRVMTSAANLRQLAA